MRIFLFLMVVQIVGSSGCWQRLPVRVLLQELVYGSVEMFTSSTPSVTRKITSCGVSLATLVPFPGFGMMLLRLFNAPAMLVSASLLLFDDVNQLFLYTGRT